MCKNLYVRLGSFHTAKNFMSVIGKHFTDSGLQEIWSKSNISLNVTYCSITQLSAGRQEKKKSYHLSLTSSFTYQKGENSCTIFFGQILRQKHPFGAL